MKKLSVTIILELYPKTRLPTPSTTLVVTPLESITSSKRDDFSSIPSLPSSLDSKHSRDIPESLGFRPSSWLSFPLLLTLGGAPLFSVCIVNKRSADKIASVEPQIRNGRLKPPTS